MQFYWGSGGEDVFSANPTNAHSGLAAEPLLCVGSCCYGMGSYKINKSDITPFIKKLLHGLLLFNSQKTGSSNLPPLRQSLH